MNLPPSLLRADLARPAQLLSPAALAALLARAPACRLLEVGCETQGAFMQAHIPGARYLDTSALEGGPYWNKLPDEALHALLGALGIGPDSCVILYGRGMLPAARAAHLLLYLGVRDVRLLDGGMAGWRGLGFACESGWPATPAPASSARWQRRADLLCDMHGVQRLLADGGTLASIRTWPEHVGATSGYQYIAARGEIPGARWGHAGQGADVNSMSDFQYPDGSMRPAAEIAAMWRACGIVPDQRVVFYCGTGWRASLAFLYAWLMGWERIAVYDGGWCEWSAVHGGAVKVA